MLSLYRFVEPLALFTLKIHGPAHPYEILGLVNQYIITETLIDPPALHRSLKTLEIHGHVNSIWQPGLGGPKRRQYSITSKGENHLLEWRTVLARLNQGLGRFIGQIDDNVKIEISDLQGVCMKIVFPFDSGQVSGHFGHCKNFLFVEVERASLQIANKEEIPRPQNTDGCGFLVNWLSEKKVNAVITLGMGEGMRRNLEKAGINVVFCKTPQMPEVLAVSYAKGLLTSNPSNNTCDHGSDHDCHAEGKGHGHQHRHGQG